MSNDEYQQNRFFCEEVKAKQKIKASKQSAIRQFGKKLKALVKKKKI